MIIFGRVITIKRVRRSKEIIPKFKQKQLRVINLQGTIELKLNIDIAILEKETVR